MGIEDKVRQYMADYVCVESSLDAGEIEAMLWDVLSVARLGVWTESQILGDSGLLSWEHVCECDGCWEQMQLAMRSLEVDDESSQMVVDYRKRTLSRIGVNADECQDVDIEFNPFVSQSR